MIFISHTRTDKPLVGPIAQRISSVFGQQNVFYDSWSIQPGDGIIDKMNEALGNCKFFFFFVSKKSLLSNMVKLEWQNAIMKASKNEIKFVPVKLDDCMMPQILLQTLYIDVYGQGFESAVRQIIDVISGNNTFKPIQQTYQNIRGYVSSGVNSIRIEFRAETYMEPHSKYLVLLKNPIEDFSYKIEGFSYPGAVQEIVINDEKMNAIPVAKAEATSPNFPCVVNIFPKEGKAISISGLMRAISTDQYKDIPVIST